LKEKKKKKELFECWESSKDQGMISVSLIVFRFA
jgi:hypothetical protein